MDSCDVCRCILSNRGSMVPKVGKWRRLVLAVALGLSFLIFSASGQNKTAESLEKLRARAEQGDADAQYKLGMAYDNGEGVPRDFVEAMRWWHKAADQGYVMSQFILGFVYYTNAKDYPEALRWYR